MYRYPPNSLLLDRVLLQEELVFEPTAGLQIWDAVDVRTSQPLMAKLHADGRLELFHNGQPYTFPPERATGKPRRTPTPPRSPRSRRRGWVLPVVLVLTVAAGAGGGWWYTTQFAPVGANAPADSTNRPASPPAESPTGFKRYQPPKRSTSGSADSTNVVGMDPATAAAMDTAFAAAPAPRPVPNAPSRVLRAALPRPNRPSIGKTPYFERDPELKP